MDASRNHQAIIAVEDLDVVVAAVTARLPIREREARRLERVGELLAASAELARRLTAQTKCALIDAHGSHGTGDLTAETEGVVEALDRYAALVHEVAMEYRYLVMPHHLTPRAADGTNGVRAGRG